MTVGGEAKLIDPSGIPHFIGDLATLDTDVMLLTADAGQFRASGSDVHTTFQHLSAFYTAPEAEQLFSTTMPVRNKSDAFADDLEKVAGALSDYSLEVQPLVQKLDALQAEATAFVNSVSGDDDWRTDQDKVDHNNDLWHDVNHTVAAFQAAERTTYNKIMSLIGGTPLTADDGSHGPHTYGFNADDLDHAEETPWGAPAEREYEGWSWLAHQGGQVWDGFWHDGVIGTVHGLGTLVGWDGADAAGRAWTNLAKLGTGAALTTATMGGWWLLPDEVLPSWLRDSRTVCKQTAKGFVAYDQWKTNPSRAAGFVGFNVLTLLGTEGAGSAASTAGKTGAAVRTLSAVGKVGRVIDPMTYVGKAGKFAFVKIGTTFTTLKNLHTGATADLLTQADALRSPKIPNNAIPYVEKATGKVVYLTDEGHILNADGSLRQHVDEAAHEVSSNNRQELSAPRSADHSRNLVGAGARAEHTTGATHSGEQPSGETGRSDGGHVASRDVSSGRPANAASFERPGTGSGGGGHGSPGTGHGLPDGPHGGEEGAELPSQRGDELHPAGEDWYDNLNPHQIKDVQVYRANHEPGYFEKYYRSNGRRLRIYITDESKYPPPHLKKDPNHPGAWIAASDKPSPFPEKYVPNSKIDRGPHTVPTNDGLTAIRDSARQRHISVQVDNAWHDPVKAAKRAYGADPTPDNLRAYEEVKAEHAPFHKEMSTDSEAFGESVARHHVIPENYEGYQWEDLSGPKNGNDQFDQVWSRTHENGVKKFVVIEAKGSDSLGLNKRELPSGFDARQGSKEYFNDILRKMRERGLAGDTNEKRLYQEIRKALKQGNVEYILVKAKSTAAGEYAGYSKWTFDIS